MIKCVPLGNWASKDLHALLSCNMGPGRLRNPLTISNVGLTSGAGSHPGAESADNEPGAALRHDNAVTGFLCTLQSA